MAQYSSSFNHAWTYDIFLNFRGQDTRTGFVGNLYKALSGKGIHTFIDDNGLERGEEITPTLLRAINESRIAIPVFSKNYAHSTFCLEELVEIIKCIKQKDRLVWPVFYDVDPSDVRHLKKSYGEALAKHEERFNHKKEKVQRWKSALFEASNLSGWHFELGYDYEFQFIEKIVKEVSKKINRLPLQIAKYPVGLEPQVQNVMSLLNVKSDEVVKMVGIYGIPGLGKTTIACAVYNLIADNFEGLCFLGDIGFNASRHGLMHLQEILLSELAGVKDIKLHNVNQGIPIIKRRLCKKKVLLILDNVIKLEQLQAIVGEPGWFGSGSIIIITTRDKHLLNVHGVERQYEAKLINHEEALELFCWNAFKSNQVSPMYEHVSNHVVRYCNGLPIALEIIGSNLFGKNLDEWNSALDAYRRIPNKNVQEILKAGYDALDEKEKEIFLDIACFFKGHNLRDVINILSNSRGFQPNYSIGVLIEKSLIKVEKDIAKVKEEIVTMHDLIEDMGKEIVRQQSPLEPGKRSRLWFNEDIVHVLEENTGTNEIEIIILDFLQTKEVRWNGKAFKKMKNLKMLIIRNAHFSIGPKYLSNSLRVLDWPEYPSSSLPSNFHPDKLVKLDLRCSCFILKEPLKNFISMSEMNLSNCMLLERVPDLSVVPNLTKLNLSSCRKLIEVDDSVGFLGKLKVLNASGCTKLRIFPNAIESSFLEDLNLTDCLSLESFPETFGIMVYVEHICLESNVVRCSDLRLALTDQSRSSRHLLCSSFIVPKIEKLMKRFKHLSKFLGKDKERMNSLVSSRLRSLTVQDCSLIDKYLCAWLGFFPCFKELYLYWSNVTDEHLVKLLPLFPNLELLNLSRTRVTIIPDFIKECHFLTKLYLDDCDLLEEIRAVPPNIKTLSAKGCTSLSAQSASILLSETLHERGGTNFMLPGVGIPEWFDHRTWGSLSFWFRNKFPETALCLINHDPFEKIFFYVSINGVPQATRFFVWSEHEVLFPCMFLLDLQVGDEGGVEFMQDAWNHVKIRTTFSFESRRFSRQGRSGQSTEIGAYIYKKQTNMVDVRFTNPNLPKRRYRKGEGFKMQIASTDVATILRLRKLHIRIRTQSW